MSKWINCNVSGKPTDHPVILDDAGGYWSGTFNPEYTRATFILPDNASGGGHLRWMDKNVNFLLPATPGSYEGASLGLPTIAYVATPKGLRIINGQFVEPDGSVWYYKGATEMLAPWRLMMGEDVRPILEQRAHAGANCVRSLAMGWPFIPNSGRPMDYPQYWDAMRRYFDLLAQVGLRCEWVVFAGTRNSMPAQNEQIAFYGQTCEVLRQYPHMLLELLNEDGHGTQSINPQAFSRPSGILASHGSGLSDEPAVSPYWDFATYHARRDRPPDARGMTNCDPYEFEANWPKPCPFLCDESMKPADYGQNPDVARLMGRHSKLGWGMAFHSQEGVESRMWPDGIRVCAEACYQGIED